MAAEMVGIEALGASSPPLRPPDGGSICSSRTTREGRPLLALLAAANNRCGADDEWRVAGGATAPALEPLREGLYQARHDAETFPGW